jgi:GH18 family chitinase
VYWLQTNDYTVRGSTPLIVQKFLPFKNCFRQEFGEFINRLVEYRNNYDPNVKILISIGGPTSNDEIRNRMSLQDHEKYEWLMLGNDYIRQKLVSHIFKLLHEYRQLDGVDLYWNLLPRLGIHVDNLKILGKNKHFDLLKELRWMLNKKSNESDKEYILTANISPYIDFYNISGIIDNSDYVLLNSYTIAEFKYLQGLLARILEK